MDNHPVVSVIIVTHNEKDEFPKCIRSLRREGTPMEIFVVDNASDEEFRRILRAINLPNLRVILNEDNLGLAQGNNQPMQQCTGDYILILNPDTEVTEGAISQLSEFLNTNPNVGAVGPMIRSSDGSVESSFFTSWSPIRNTFRGWIKLPSSPASRRRSVTASGTQDVLFVSGACLLIRRETFVRLGGYDPNFFLSLEDVADLCLRVHRSGYRVTYYPEARITHMGARGHRGYGSIFWGYQGHLYFQLKHGGESRALLLRIALLVDSLIETAVMLLTSIFNKRHRVFLFVYTFTAAKLMTRRTSSLYGDGMRLNRMLTAKSRYT